MSATNQDFFRRVSRIPHHGVGLSVDVYQPDLLTLMTALENRGLSPDYLEIFKASTQALSEIRRRLPSMLLEYHAEGLWVTQPDFLTRYRVDVELGVAAEHLLTLESWWANYEGATKEMAGYSFGTYLPPLFTRASAEVTAGNIAWVQERLDHLAQIADGVGPLFLLETPPLTYFGFGDLDMAEFFAHVADQVSCGIVLDIGHIWTVYRYGENHRQRSLDHFLCDFLNRFPLERVVHIHLAGLAVHDQMPVDRPVGNSSNSLPWWLDAHGAPIPPILFNMLEQVLSHPRLTHVRGLALEVDTKTIPEITEEFQLFRRRFGTWAETVAPMPASTCSADASRLDMPRTPSEGIPDQQSLPQLYATYARVVTDSCTAEPSTLPTRWIDPDALALYRLAYLPNEILHWGGELKAMFPETCELLQQAGVALDGFVNYWFREPRESDPHYDFFELKMSRFTAFVRERLPQAAACVEREAETLRTGYHEACDIVDV